MEAKKKNLNSIRIIKELKKTEPIELKDQDYPVLKGSFEILFVKSMHSKVNRSVESHQAILGIYPEDFIKTVDLFIKKRNDDNEI